jgi:hypothetical protein
LNEDNGGSKDQDVENQIPNQLERSLRYTFLGFLIIGDDVEPGPIFNYARVWGHMNAVAIIVEAFRASTYRQKHRKRVDGGVWDDANWDANLKGEPEQMSRYISDSSRDVEVFHVYSKPLQDMRWNCVKAASVAIFLGWGTTGAGLVIAYE